MKTNIAEFLRKFKSHQQISLTASAKATNYALLTTYRNIVQRTPVGDPALWHPPYWPKGYVPGDLKKSWHISFNNKQRNLKGHFASTSQVTSNYGLSFKVGTTSKQFAVIYNSQPYAQRVEDGWSTQAPSGMMKISIAEWASNLDRAAIKYKVK